MSNWRSALLSDALKFAVLDKIEECIRLATNFYDCSFPVGEVNFNLRGRAAGQVRFPIIQTKKRYTLFGQVQEASSLPEIRFNPTILNLYKEEFIQEVVPHECAHLVVFRLFQLKKLPSKQKPKPHGREWQSVMRELYGVEPRVTHQYEVKTSAIKRYSYCCACVDKVHQLTVIRHNKIRRNLSQYKCRRCGEILKQVDALAI